MEKADSRYVIAYDVPDTPRRNRIAALLTAHGERLQKSVFEAVIEPAEMELCLKQIHSILKPEEDSLAVYRLCRACDRNRLYFGCADDTLGTEDVFIV